MKKLIPALIIILITLVACGKKPPAPGSTIPVTTEQTIERKTEPESTEPEPTYETEAHEFVEINLSPDKYTWYLKDYYWKNLASFGHTTMGGFRSDDYGDGYVRLSFLAPNGEFVDIRDENDLKNWRVIGQNVAPNTEIKYIFEREENGTESDWVAYQNVEEVVLALAPVGKAAKPLELTPIDPSPNPHINYVRDYVGRNLSQCGYVNVFGDLIQQYGTAYIDLVVNAEDGSFVDVKDEDSLKNYVVTRQSIAPNTELKMTFEKDSQGKEAIDEIHAQSIEKIDLSVVPLSEYHGQSRQTGGQVPVIADTEMGESGQKTAPETVTVPETTSVSESAIRPEFKKAMDAYEEFYDEYCEFLEKYSKNPSDATLIGQYGKMMTKMTEVNAAFEKWNDADMTTAEAAYYLEVNSRVLQKLAKVMG